MQLNDFRIDKNLKEETKHRTPVLPLACYHTKIRQHIHGFIPLHWHNEIQFVLITEGQAIFQVNEERLIVREGEGLFINSGCLHMAESNCQSDCSYICLNISPHFILPQELFTKYVSPYIQATNLAYLYIKEEVSWGKSILASIRNVYHLVREQPDFYEINITYELTSIWKHLIINGFPLEYNQAKVIMNQRMKNMVQWIHEHYSEKIKLEAIASAGGLSRSECCRYFKRTLKSSPMQYVTDYRIQKSLILLQRPEANVTEVAYEAGFTSTSYFIEKFKKVMNMTPLAYKKSLE